MAADAESKIYSHDQVHQDFDAHIAGIRKRLTAIGETQHGAVSEKLHILDQLTQFPLGRFVLMNGGLNGRWSHYVFYEYTLPMEQNKTRHAFETRLLNLWHWGSTRHRLILVRQILAPELKDGIKLLSVPCGFMAELLTLDYSKTPNVKITGVDLDPESVEGAKKFATERGLARNCEFHLRDAWKLGYENEFDRVLSLGLNVYAPTQDSAMDLYRSLYKAVRPGGKLLVTYAPPYHPPEDDERDLSTVNPEDIRLQRIIFTEIIQMKYSHRNTSAQIVDRLKGAGFSEVKCYYGKYRSQNIAVATK